MGLLALFETPAGYALFNVLDNKKMSKVDNIAASFENEDDAKKMVKLKQFCKFEDTSSALAAAASIVDGKLDKSLKKFLTKTMGEEPTDKLAVMDAKLGSLLKKKLNIDCIFDQSAVELMRGIRSQLECLLGGVAESDLRAMKLGLSHSLARYKLKFSPDKVDTMIIQAISLLDELDKELNTYAMRVREWYGWHFPEMGKIVTDNVQYAKVVKKMGIRQAASSTDLSDILAEETEKEVKDAAEVSMGTEIAEEDVANISALCDQVVSIHEYRANLFDYLKNRMAAIAPNLTVMVGELVGARLIAHAGSLLALAKHPASTVQILGAEKALFRALKTKHDTPKYGLIFHASLVGHAAPKHKGKISRVLAAKTSLSVRMDALGETEGVTIATAAREKVELRLRALENGTTKGASGSGKTGSTPAKYTKPQDTAGYNAAADATAGIEEESAPKKEKKKKRDREEEPEAAAEEEAPKKKKKKAAEEPAEEPEEPVVEKKKKKKKTQDDE